MSDYRVAPGHGVAYGSLSLFVPQPRQVRGVQATQVTYGTSGKKHRMGLHAELLWSSLEQQSSYAAILTLCGLSETVLENTVTVNLRNGVYTYNRYNAIVYFPEPGADIVWENYFLRDLVLLFRNMQKL